MNLLTIIIAIYLLLQTLLGSKRGFFKSVVALLIIVGAMFLASRCSPQVATAIKNNTDLDEVITVLIVDSLEKGETPGAETEVIKEYEDDNKAEKDRDGKDTNKDGKEMGNRSWQKEQLKNSGFPLYIQQVLGDNSNTEFFEALGVDNFYHYIAEYFCGIIINIIAYLLTFIGLWALFHIMASALGVVFELPIINGLNRVGGALFGLGKGVLMVSLFFLLITIFSSTDFGQVVIQSIEKSPILYWLYQNNPSLELVSDITKQIF